MADESPFDRIESKCDSYNYKSDLGPPNISGSELRGILSFISRRNAEALQLFRELEREVGELRERCATDPWWWAYSEYLDEGWCGPFQTREEAEASADDALGPLRPDDDPPRSAEDERPEVVYRQHANPEGCMENERLEREVERLMARLHKTRDAVGHYFGERDAYDALGPSKWIESTAGVVRDLTGRSLKAEAELTALRARERELIDYIREAREAMRRHDRAPFQCESSEGAGGAMECVRILDTALAGGQGEEPKDAG
jgi:hypothetical protein